MGRSERDRRSSERRRLALPALAFASIAGCASLVSLEDRSCPCAEGWVCCEATDTCLQPEETCDGNSNGGSGGTSVPHGGSSSGGRGGSASGTGGASGSSTGGSSTGGSSTGGSSTGGAGMQGGSAGEAGGGSGDGGMGGKPDAEWRPVGPELLDEPQTTSEPDLELAPDGTPYLAFRGCEDCDLLTLTHVPRVERFDSRWRVLPNDGLPATAEATPALALDTDGTPHLLVDGVVSSFDGAVWHAFPSALPGPASTDPNFQVDGSGDYWATLYDMSRGEISVVRSQGSSFVSVGSVVAGRKDGVRLVLGSDGEYLAHTAPDGVHVFVRKLVGSDWSGDELAGELVDIAQAPDGSLCAAVWNSTYDAVVYHGSVGSLGVLGPLNGSWVSPGLQVANDGTLFVVLQPEDFVNVNYWDGANFRDVDSMKIGNGTGEVLRLLTTMDGTVPYVAFMSNSALKVKKYE